jgi:hypothetical protein
VRLDHWEELWFTSLAICKLNSVSLISNCFRSYSSNPYISFTDFPYNIAWFFRFSNFLGFFSSHFYFELVSVNLSNSVNIGFSHFLSRNLGYNNWFDKFVFKMNFSPFAINWNGSSLNPSTIRKLVSTSFDNHIRNSFSSMPDV